MNYHERGTMAAHVERTEVGIAERGGPEHRDALFPGPGETAYATDEYGNYGTFITAVMQMFDDELDHASLPVTLVALTSDQGQVLIVKGRIAELIEAGRDTEIVFVDDERVALYDLVGIKF